MFFFLSSPPPTPHCLHGFLCSETEGRLWASWLASKPQVAACPPPERRLTDLHCRLRNGSALASPNHSVETQHPLKNPSLSTEQFLLLPPSRPQQWQNPGAVQSWVEPTKKETRKKKNPSRPAKEPGSFKGTWMDSAARARQDKSLYWLKHLWQRLRLRQHWSHASKSSLHFVLHVNRHMCLNMWRLMYTSLLLLELLHSTNKLIRPGATLPFQST